MQQMQPPQHPQSMPYAQPHAYYPYASVPAQGQTYASVPAPRRHSFISDVFRGAFLGDYATDLGIPGAVTQIICGFLPAIGDLCAMRDITADLGRRDWVGVGLNCLALIPVAGGFPKTIEVIRSLSHVGHVIHKRRHDSKDRRRVG